MEYLIGGFLAVVTALSAGASGFARDRSFFPTVMIVIATYYVLFAAMGGSVPALWKESAIGLGFAVVAVLGFKASLWWVAASLRERHVIVRHFRQPRIEKFLRITVGTQSQCRTLVEALGAILEP